MAEAQVLLIDDDEALGRVMGVGFESRGYDLRIATTGGGGLDAVDQREPDVVILDLGLPDLDGIDVCRHLRRRTRSPIIVLSADGAEDRKVAALDEGADDYLTKPFSFPVLVARLRAVARRGARERPTLWEVGDLRVDPAARRVWRGETEIALTAREFSTLAFLARHAGDVVSKRQILEAVWDADFDGDPNIVEVYVRHLRNKVDRPFGREAIETVRGAGYRLASDGG